MQEEFLLERMIRGKTEEEQRIELMQTIMDTKEKLKIAISNFEYAEDELIDYYIYQMKANQAKLDYLIKLAKSKGIALNRINELKMRTYRKNNMAV
ncbi:MAG: YaaL family protein [Clostridia bacterium]|nr:YaaL family protein [Clostridia bacterium]